MGHEAVEKAGGSLRSVERTGGKQAKDQAEEQVESCHLLSPDIFRESRGFPGFFDLLSRIFFGHIAPKGMR
jgi:hypothetical protein